MKFFHEFPSFIVNKLLTTADSNSRLTSRPISRYIWDDFSSDSKEQPFTFESKAVVKARVRNEKIQSEICYISYDSQT